MKSIRCKLGWHKPKQIPCKRVDIAFGGAVWSEVNAKCERCSEEQWINW